MFACIALVSIANVNLVDSIIQGDLMAALPLNCNLSPGSKLLQAVTGQATRRKGKAAL